jgi:hypothetical protein
MRFWVIALLFVFSVPTEANQISYVDMVNKLTDLEALAVTPEIGEKCAQWSSYDRASKYDEATGKYIHWDANGDGNGVIQLKNDEALLAEMKGPGCIWRIWSALPGSGKVKIYTDSRFDEAALDYPFSDYFTQDIQSFYIDSLIHTAASGKNWYVPIPYQRSCVIMAEKDWGNYYQFTYSTFPEGTNVPSYNKGLSEKDIEALRQTDKFITFRLGRDPAGVRKGEISETKTITLAPGTNEVVSKLTGPRAITAIRLAIDPAWSDPEKQLREVVLKISWDGEKQPSVWVPLGDFFGAAPGIQKYKSLPMGVTGNEMYSLWYMPFAKDATIELQNDGNKAFPVSLTITSAPLTRPVEDLMRFHAKWHRDEFLPTEPERAIDWTILKTNGRGRYVGVMLDVRNPKGEWWGEGDEKFFVDGEKFPSTFGTGSEDYFGYAWCSQDYFENAFHNQTRQATGNKWASLNRWQIADNVPFQKSFEGYIEKYFSNDRPTKYACVAYWYLAPGGEDPYNGLEPASERTNYCPTETAK